MVSKTQRFSAGFCISLAIILLIVPFSWLVSMLIAAAFHEICHLGAIRVLSGKTGRVYFRLAGPRIDLPELSPGREALCALSGPLGGLLLLLLVDVFPKLAICGLIQSVYNLLPMYPLDGGRALRSILSMMLPPPKVKQYVRVIEFLCRMGILAAGIWGCFWGGFGLLSFLVCMVIVIRVK